MAAPLLFYDLSLLPSPSSASSGDGRDGTFNSSSSRLQLLAATLELGYAAVALDHPHRGLLADSHRCRTERFAPLSSLPLPSSAALHRRRLASPASEPFHQYTRITLSLDSAAAAASALAPSTARLLRTYDLVAARPLTQAAFDHLCQASITAQHLDLISIDFSSHTKLPFRIKPPMLKLALKKGLHFEIAYSPLISTDVNAKRNLIAEVKLLVEWTKGKNLIISSAAHTASQIRGPYDVINLSAYLLGIPTDRAKAAMSTDCRLLVSKAMRKKHFYKETIRVDRLLPNEQLSPTKFKLADWIGWNSVSSEGWANQMVPSSDVDELTGSPTCVVMEGSHKKPQSPDVCVFAKLSEQSSGQEQIPSQNQEETLQVDRTEVLTDCGQSILPASLSYQNAILEKAENNEVVSNPFVHAGAGCSADPKVIVNVKRVEFVQDAMEVDMIESRRLNIVLGENIPSTSDTSTKLACCAFPHGKLSATILENQGPSHSSEILDDDKSYMKYHTDCTSGVSEKTVLAHEISSGVDVCPDDKDSDKSNRMQVDNEAYKPLECPPGGVDDKEPSDLSFYLSHELCRDVIIQPKVMEGKVEQSSDENIAKTVENEAESVDTKAISVEPMSHCQEISSTSYTRSTGAGYENDELKEQNSKDINASLDKSVDKTHELLQLPYPSGKRRHKLRLHHPSYLPFLGFLWSVCFKKKICKVACKRES